MHHDASLALVTVCAGGRWFVDCIVYETSECGVGWEWLTLAHIDIMSPAYTLERPHYNSHRTVD